MFENRKFLANEDLEGIIYFNSSYKKNRNSGGGSMMDQEIEWAR